MLICVFLIPFYEAKFNGPFNIVDIVYHKKFKFLGSYVL